MSPVEVNTPDTPVTQRLRQRQYYTRRVQGLPSSTPSATVLSVLNNLNCANLPESEVAYTTHVKNTLVLNTNIDVREILISKVFVAMQMYHISGNGAVGYKGQCLNVQKDLEQASS